MPPVLQSRVTEQWSGCPPLRLWQVITILVIIMMVLMMMMMIDIGYNHDVNDNDDGI